MEKITYFSLNKDNTEVLDGDLIKIAALKLPTGIEYDPDYLYLKVRAVSAGEYWGCNKNYDYFPEEDLKKCYKTFLNAHVFKNHENKQIENAIGDVLRTDWDDSMKCVVLLIRIDKRLAPTIVRGFEKGFMTDVSMGCRVDYSVCSICGNKAKTRFQFCNHIKDERGKVYNDGRKVYEINVAPKFHDISAVLTGAERSAKAVEIYNIEKTASFKDDSIEKTTSFMESLIESGKILESQQKQLTEKIASEQLNEAMSKKHEDKKDFKDKVGSIKKEIQGEVIKTAKDNVAKKGLESLESLSKIVRMLFTDYWDKNKCRGIAEQIKHIADDKDMDVEEVFDQFLKVLDFANINLTPTELHDIRMSCLDKKDNVDLRKIELPIKQDAEEVSSVVDSILNKNDVAPTAKMTMIVVNKSPLAGPSLLERVNTFKRVDDGYNDSIIPIIMRRIVSPLIAGRSDHPRHLAIRLSKIANEEVKPHYDFARYYSPLFLMDKEASEFKEISKSAMVYSAYQNDRVNRFNNGDLALGMMKFASIVDENNPISNLGNQISLEKTAKIKPTKLALGTIPATFTYSALQRSRLNNGEDISSVNRYIAENPTNASLIAAAGVKAGTKSLKGATPKIKDLAKKGKGLSEKVVDYFKISEEENIDMFKNAKIDNIMFKKGYSSNQLDSMKKACVLYCLDDYVDDADQILQKMSLDESNVNDYLKESSNFYKIEIEKCASANLLKNIKDSVVGGMLFRNTKNSSPAAQLPGMVFDGLALTAVSKGIKKAKQKLNGPDAINNTQGQSTQIEN